MPYNFHWRHLVYDLLCEWHLYARKKESYTTSNTTKIINRNIQTNSKSAKKDRGSNKTKRENLRDNSKNPAQSTQVTQAPKCKPNYHDSSHSLSIASKLSSLHTKYAWTLHTTSRRSSGLGTAKLFTRLR